MKLAHPFLDCIINLNLEDKVNILVVENQKLFCDFVSDITNQIGKNNGKFVLSKDNNPIDMSKFSELISTFIPFDINQKSLLSKLFQKIQLTMVDENFYVETKTIVAKNLEYINKIISDLDFNIDVSDDFDILYILKAAEVKFNTDYKSLSEKMLEYMITVNQLESEKLFILVNLRSYICNEEIDIFYKNILYNKLKVLILSGCNYEASSYENKIIIDKDLCII